MGPTAVWTGSDNLAVPAFAAALAATKVFRFVFQDAMEQPTSLDTDDPFAIADTRPQAASNDRWIRALVPSFVAALP